MNKKMKSFIGPRHLSSNGLSAVYQNSEGEMIFELVGQFAGSVKMQKEDGSFIPNFSLTPQPTLTTGLLNLFQRFGFKYNDFFRMDGSGVINSQRAESFMLALDKTPLLSEPTPTRVLRVGDAFIVFKVLGADGPTLQIQDNGSVIEYMGDSTAFSFLKEILKACFGSPDYSVLASDDKIMDFNEYLGTNTIGGF